MLTAKSQVVDKVVGLKLGADDYLTKPFDPSELLARIEALLRRTKKENRPNVRTYTFGDVTVDFERGEVRKGGNHVQMAIKELLLLRYLVDQRGRVIPREELLEKVWEYQSEVNSRTIDVHIAWLRQKLEDIPQTPTFIHTIRGKGYRFAD
jgi:two-component system alkaline phosphatase synthesis response regulator PhoP